jgi:hypothetical protein
LLFLPFAFLPSYWGINGVFVGDFDSLLSLSCNSVQYWARSDRNDRRIDHFKPFIHIINEFPVVSYDYPICGHKHCIRHVSISFQGLRL